MRSSKFIFKLKLKEPQKSYVLQEGATCHVWIGELAPVPNSHVLADAASSRFPLQSSKELPFEY